MKSFLPGLFFLLGCVFTAPAQRLCETIDNNQSGIRSNQLLNDVPTIVENQPTTITGQPIGNIAAREINSSEIIYIPVVIHVLYKNAAENISDAQIQSQLDALNRDFRLLNDDRINIPQAFKSLAGDAGIQFCLAKVDPQGRRTNGIDRKYTRQDFFTTDDGMKIVNRGGAASWDNKRYLNIWVCKLTSRSLGYATPPGASADKDGVVIASDVFGTIGNLRAGFNKGRTATHEIGHWLDLIHIWGDAACGDDHVDDTPPQQSYNFGCQNFPKVSNCSKDSNGDMFMNFMDFTDDACMNMFTKGQVKRMRTLFEKNHIRNSFLSSFACDSTTVQVGPVSAQVDESAIVQNVSSSSIKVYPNPVHTVTTIECKTATVVTIQNLSIFNSVGVNVFTTRLTKEKTILNLAGLVPGVYIIHIGNGPERFITRIVKL